MIKMFEEASWRGASQARGSGAIGCILMVAGTEVTFSLL